LLASVAIGCFFWPVVRDQWIQERALVAGRFDEAGTLRVLFVLLTTVAASSGLLWRHQRRIDSYGSPLEPLISGGVHLVRRARGGNPDPRHLCKLTSQNSVQAKFGEFAFQDIGE
jgi:hypothetical protein